MSDALRCEPPGELRGLDGWHWVQFGKWAPRFAEWQAAPYGGRQPLWKDYERQQSCTPEWAAKEWGWRYLGPVLTPAEIAALRAERDAFQREAAWRENDQRSEAAKWATESATLRARVAVLEDALERISNHPEAEIVLTDYGPDDRQRVWPTVAQEARVALPPMPAAAPASELRNGDHPV